MTSPLTTGSDVECGHKGTVSTSSSVKLTVDGNPVLVADGVVSKTVSGCTTPSSSGPPPTSPCISVQSILPTCLATKLTAGGAAVVLDTLAGLTDGAPPGTLAAVAGQSKLNVV
jgi:hypothetical protein